MRKYVLVLGGLCLLSATVAASPQTSGGTPTPVHNAQPQERKEVTVPEEILETLKMGKRPEVTLKKIN